MPKNRWHEFPCGAIVRFKEHRFEDMVDVDFILQNIPKEELKKIVNPDSTGRKRNLTAQRVYSKIVRLFWKKVVDRLMESDRLVIDRYTSLYIGETPEGKVVKRRKKKLNYTGVKIIYRIILNGFFHNYYFRMPFRRRKELRQRIENGQTFT